jgi:phosphate transport system substrate-binding protein
MIRRPRHPRHPRRVRLVTGALAVLLLSLLPALATAAPTARLSGSGSSWAGNALNDWVTSVKSQGVVVDYDPAGSSTGRKNFALGLADFAVSEIPYTGDTADPQDTQRPNFGYAMLPVVAGGTSFMYNLPVGGKQFTGLKLSQAALAKIFAGEVTRWNDPVIAATNKGVALPDQRITVVVRSDGSGATAQFTLWMLRQFPKDYQALCQKTGCNPRSATSYYPYQGLDNFTAQAQSNGVTTYTTNTPYTINYDEYSYPQAVGFPSAQIQNAAGFFTLPDANAVAVALTQAKINTDKTSQNYLAQDLSKVYAYRDPRTYPISAYSYLVVPTATHGNFNTAKGATLGYFSAFSLCEGQRTMGSLGYSPLPMNLVLAAMDQVLKVPGVDADTRKTIQNTKSGVTSGSSNPCNNPTFRPGDNPAHNLLTDSAPFPAGCDAACQAPWLSPVNSGGPGGGGGGGTHHGGTTNPDKSPTTGPSQGAGGGPSTPSSSQTPADPAATTAPPVCDPDTGQCSTSGPSTGDGSDAVAAPTNLASSPTWGGAQLALILCLGFLALLLLVPPLAARAIDARGRAGRTPAAGPSGPPGPPAPQGPPAPASQATPPVTVDPPAPSTDAPTHRGDAG